MNWNWEREELDVWDAPTYVTDGDKGTEGVVELGLLAFLDMT